MNKNSFFKNIAFAVAIALAFCGLNSVLADDTNAPATNAIAANAGTQNYYGLPKEAFERLSPEQIVALARVAQENRGGNSPLAKSFTDIVALIFIPLGLFATICVGVVMGVKQRVKRNQMMHETIRQMIEKGQPIPPELLQPTEPQQGLHCDLRRGLICIAVGIGLGALLLARDDKDWPVALIPLLIGLAFLATWKFSVKINGPKN
jgi:hypothetical protein